VTSGGRKLLAYIAKRYEGNKAAFADDAGVNRLTVFRVTSGKLWQNVNVAFAVAVERATGGAVRVEDFMPGTAVAVVRANGAAQASTGTHG
jgi:hypothetical protein